MTVTIYNFFLKKSKELIREKEEMKLKYLNPDLLQVDLDRSCLKDEYLFSVWPGFARRIE